MKIIRNTIPISDLFNLMAENELIINRTYQRSQGLWPQNARSYFIDTLLNDFPFPKIVIRQVVDLKTKRTKREIIDGQQRLTTIKDFIEDKFKLSNVSRHYRGQQFSVLPDDVKTRFLSYEVSTDTVVSATDEEVLEIFRRINSYTLPLKEPEKRHASYQGEFKWFIKDLLELYSPMLEKYKVLTLRDISRMVDAELLTELCQVALDGIKNRRTAFLEKIYKDNDASFPKREEVYNKVVETLDFIKVELNPVLESEVLKGYSLYSLFSALVYNRYGLPNISSKDVGGLEVIGEYTPDTNQAIQNILELFNLAEQNNERGKYAAFVRASGAATTSETSRRIRLEWLVRALQNRLD
ncbi:DUF262 domain-containing protein [Leptolyngbya sp. AN03gr2]|uniref:DUF262 domain-containing protein n=1 Tax=unclassified Leptolyngbya TaxID=2650499 RepID=UPI003D31242A